MNAFGTGGGKSPNLIHEPFGFFKRVPSIGEAAATKKTIYPIRP